MQRDAHMGQVRKRALKPPIDLENFQRFIAKASSGSMPLFIAAMAALVWANGATHSYHAFWHTQITFEIGHWHISKSMAHWIDDALMTLFFFTVGMEIKREILVGELASIKKAMLPIAAALGGMVVPAAIYVLFNYNQPTLRGWGIPMATDIAFALAVLAVLDKRVPMGLRIFLSALAIADDLGAVLVIAIFYTQAISWSHLLVALMFMGGLLIANWLWVRRTPVYVVLGIGVWLAIMGSGVHATAAGAIVAMFIPARGKYDTDVFISEVQKNLDRFECEDDSCGFTILLNKNHLASVLNIEMACHHVETPIQRMEYALHSLVAYLILPLFALANAGLVLRDLDIAAAVAQPVTLGIVLGLVLGKPAGIFLFTFLSVHVLRADLPMGVSWRHIAGVSMLGGIGFTMSLFISGLSFPGLEYAAYSKLGIITGSIIAGTGGLLILWFSSRAPSA
jgi:NhaA family Na+:H+ antiporter